jgi:hypothetical protein
MVKGGPSAQRDFQRYKDTLSERRDRERQSDKDRGIKPGSGYVGVRPKFEGVKYVNGAWVKK